MANLTVNDRIARVLAELQDGKQHVWKARNYRALYEKEVGVRPPYPRSRVALQNLQAELGRFKAAKKQGRRDRELQIQNEFLRLVAVQEDIHETFDLDKNIPPLNVKPPFKRELLQI